MDNAINEDGFRVERSLDNFTYVLIGSVGPDVAVYADTGLDAGTLYWYRVKAYNEDRKSVV